QAWRGIEADQYCAHGAKLACPAGRRFTNFALLSTRHKDGFMNSCLTRALCGWLAPGFLAAAALVGHAGAQPLSDKQLRIVVPFPAGGTADILPRIVAEELRPQLPEGVIVDNRAGAGGNIGAEQVYRAEPDGST